MVEALDLARFCSGERDLAAAAKERVGEQQWQRGWVAVEVSDMGWRESTSTMVAARPRLQGWQGSATTTATYWISGAAVMMADSGGDAFFFSKLELVFLDDFFAENSFYRKEA